MEQLIEEKDKEIHNLKTILSNTGNTMEATTIKQWMDKLLQIKKNLQDKDQQLLLVQHQLAQTLTQLADKQKEITIQTTQIVTTRKELKQSTKANCAYINKLIDTQRKIIQTETITTNTHQKLLEQLYESQMENKDTSSKITELAATMEKTQQSEDVEELQ